MTQPNADPPGGGPLEPVFDGEDTFPDPSELTHYFREQFQERIVGLEQAWSDRDLRAIQEMTSGLRGDASACEFPKICGEAWQLETGLTEEAQLSSLCEKIEDLITLCRQTNSRRRI